MKLEVATEADLSYVLEWLKQEDAEFEAALDCDEEIGVRTKGFWCNRNVIRQCFSKGELEVIRVDGRAVAFHLGQFVSPGITEVHPKFRGSGIGSAIVSEVIQRARQKQFFILHVSCISAQSQRFWSKFGFIPDEQGSEEYYRTFDYGLLLPGPPNDVATINFFDERGWYSYLKDAYKRVEIPCYVAGNQAYLSQICHDAVINSKAFGDRFVQVIVGQEVVHEDWLGTQETKAFGFEPRGYGRYHSASCFNLALGRKPA